MALVDFVERQVALKLVYYGPPHSGKTSNLRALWYAHSGVLPWLVWTLLLGWMRRQAGEYHPPVGETPLDRSRRRCAIAMLVIFFLIATPVPFRPAL